MADDGEYKKRLVTSIIHFLRNEKNTSQLSSENREGLEVALQCLETIYNIKETTQTEPTLSEIYRTYLLTSVINKPNASEEDKKQAEILKVEGNTAVSKGELPEALELYTKAIKIDPKNAVYYCNRAAVYSKMLNHKQAVLDCKTALEIDPKYSKAYGRLGLAYCGLKDYTNALDYYKKAIELEPTNEGYLRNYELALEKTNNASCDTCGSQNSDTVPEEILQNLNALFRNTNLLNMATEMLSDPNMQNIISNLIATGRGQFQSNDIQNLFTMGQRFAQRIQADNPQFVDDMRATIDQCTDSEVGSQEVNSEESPEEDHSSPADQQN